MFRELRTSFSLFILLGLLTGVVYPAAVLGIGQFLFPHQAKGSLIEDNGAIIGSSLIGQNFVQPGYFHGRPSYAGNGYDAANSSGSNLAPSSADLIKAVGGRVQDLRNGGISVSIPADLVTGSASGLDPHISVAAAMLQAGRVAEVRQIPITAVDNLVSRMTERRSYGVLGENRVNVLQLNRALDQMAPAKP